MTVLKSGIGVQIVSIHTFSLKSINFIVWVCFTIWKLLVASLCDSGAIRIFYFLEFLANFDQNLFFPVYAFFQILEAFVPSFSKIRLIGQLFD